MQAGDVSVTYAGTTVLEEDFGFKLYTLLWKGDVFFNVIDVKLGKSVTFYLLSNPSIKKISTWMQV